MNLNTFFPCNPAHRDNFQYCCFKTKRVFCHMCWYSQNHYINCNSSKCGHIEKIAHKVIGTTLQMKVMQSIAEMCPDFDTYDQFYRKILGYSHMMTRKIKSDIQNKLPLFIWISICQMLASKCPKLKQVVFDDAAGFDMIKIIKGKQQSKVKQLEQVIKSISQVTHQYDGLHNIMRQKKFTGNLDKQVSQVISFCTKKTPQLMSGLTTSIKKHIESQYGKLLKQFDSNIKQFDGVKFVNRRNFNHIQCYNQNSIYSTISQQSASAGKFYHGTLLDIQILQQTPEMLLQVSKSMLKQKIFQIHSQIKQMKSIFPYKYAYIMCTTLEPDPDYEMTIINLQRNYIKQYQKKPENCFLNSINLVIMGPELIIIQSKNYPKKAVDIYIYGYISSREKHYNDIIQALGIMKTIKQKKLQKNIKHFKFQQQQQLKPVQLAYVQFYIVYGHLFTNSSNLEEFEGEKYVLGRGIKLLEGIVKNWRQKACIQFQIEKKIQQLLPYFI